LFDGTSYECGNSVNYEENIIKSWPTPSSSNVSVWTTIYPWCDTYDRVVSDWTNTYTIAACNVWATKAWAYTHSCNNYITAPNLLTITDNNCSTDKRWFHFQWSVNTWFRMEDNPFNVTPAFLTWTGDLSWYWNRDWKSIVQSEPCATWYHLPSADEWTQVVSLWWWWTDWIQFWMDLLLPMAWHRFWPNAFLKQIWWTGYYWTKQSFGTTNAWYLLLNTLPNINITSWSRRNYGMSIRCFRD
jgi:hypothetical protein